MKILITGGYGKLGGALTKVENEHHIVPIDSVCDIRNRTLVESYIGAINPDCVIHTAALTKPMQQHETDPDNSIHTNIIGTANIAIACQKQNIKLIYISTDYVYPGITGNYSENDPVLPFTNYGWSKLGGECAVRMISNSLIIRLCLCNKPFEHEYAFDDMIKNYIYEKEAAEIIFKLIDQEGIINVGGPTQSVYDFVKQNHPDIDHGPTKYFKKIPLNTSMNLEKMNALS